jgi:hypothetical protein
MPMLDHIRARKLIQLAYKRFNPRLSDAELQVLRDSASSADPVVSKSDEERPTIRPEFVRWLATDPEAIPFIDPKGLRIYGFTVSGPLDLRECRIHLPLHFIGCIFEKVGSEDLFSINLQFTETQTVFLRSCKIRGDIEADGITMHGPLSLRLSEFSGMISLKNARIKGNLDCAGAKLTVKTEHALDASRAEIDGCVYLNEGFTSSGTILLHGSWIKSDLSCISANLVGAEMVSLKLVRGVKYALIADRAEIDGGVFLRDGFSSSGVIRLVGARIGGQFDFRGAMVDEVICRNLQVGTDLLWISIKKTGKTFLDLTGVKVKNLRESQDSWPEAEKLVLDGLVYEELTLHESSSAIDFKAGDYPEEKPLVAKDRIDWIMLQPPKRCTEAQPWMQLRDLLERKGDRKGAKYVLFRFRCLQAGRLEWHPLQWVWSVLLSVGRLLALVLTPKKTWRRVWPYLRHPNRAWHRSFAWLEENPLRIGYSILFTLALGTLVFTGAVRSGAMIETVQIQPNMIATYAESIKGTAKKPDESIRPVSIHHPSFQPFFYTLENAVPLVRLGIDERWMPDLQHQPRPWFPQIGWLDGLKWLNSYGFLVWFRWLLIVWGWVQATIFAASVADRFRK